MGSQTISPTSSLKQESINSTQFTCGLPQAEGLSHGNCGVAIRSGGRFAHLLHLSRSDRTSALAHFALGRGVGEEGLKSN